MIYLQDLADWGLLGVFSAGVHSQREIVDVEYEEITDADVHAVKPKTNRNDEADTEPKRMCPSQKPLAL